MYRIVKDGAALALIEAPTYVRQAGNGCFVLCQEDVYKRQTSSRSTTTPAASTCWPLAWS